MLVVIVGLALGLWTGWKYGDRILDKISELWDKVKSKWY